MQPQTLARRGFLPLFATPLLAACAVAQKSAGPAIPAANGANTTVSSAAPAAVPTSVAPATEAPAALQPTAPSAGALTFRVRANDSKATFRVREQLAGRQLPNDAVGTTGAVTGQLALTSGGDVVADASKITVDLRSLATDNSMRDQFIKQNTLQTSRFPTAEFVPTDLQGLPDPLPASGEHTFKMIGLMTVHGVQREIAWDVTARRAANELLGKASTTVKFGDFGMTPPRAAAVLSVTDEIRLELDLAASQTA